VERIAKEGYVAIAPALLLCPGFETGYTPEDIEIAKLQATNHQSYWAIFKQRLTTSKTNPK